ncbi:HlyD family efflux transporter periplasmic adaptor subunit [Azospirillum thermophilum]|uniref:Secretion protein HylD n=1 Tax=Azospirillum thermophilum TaxID=2202148 RepID=A0A2S2CZ14_9PROT|nr:HlyD family efflux transporter periplasmic adaptor subunit [Azospirillum thermophilum]AWK89731.1 secretion protein HylD [Azospirillum thermophilum]
MLPHLRDELVLYSGPRTADGAPTWSLHDPVRNVFFSIDWPSFEILCRWTLGEPGAILASLNEGTPLQAELEDVKAVERFLLENELVRSDRPQQTARLRQQAEKRRARPGRWLLHHYLFFRVPLWRPDRWLARTLPWVEPLFSRSFMMLTLLALAVGLFETSRQWEHFVTTLVDTFSMEGVAGFMVALVFAKLLHELGHAYTAKRFGCRVPAMGVAFLVLFPVAYTDVNEVWKLDDRRKRLAVGFAGIRTEILLAAWATLFWALAPDGAFRGMMFMLATTTWVTTVAVNASPFMRFDGYFMLMDWTGLANLHQRASAMGRWRLRELLFGLGDPPPEALPAGQRRGMVLFAYATWAYRLVVFGGIAILVYNLAPKPVGPLLGAIELWVFILQPVWRELSMWGKTMGRIARSARFLATLGVLAALAAVALVPWDSRIHAQGLLRPVGYYSIIVPEAARVVAMPVASGAAVAKDDILFELDSPDLDYKHRAKEIQAATTSWQTAAAGVNGDLREKLGTIQATRARLAAEIVGVSAERSRFQIKAPADGTVFLSDLSLRPGNWIKKNETIATLLDGRRWQVVTYLPEADLARVRVGDAARFYPEHSGLDVRRLTVAAIDRDATRVLSDGILGSTSGGRILVRDTAGGPVPETAIYRVTLSLPDDQPPQAAALLRGSLVLSGAPKSLMGDFLRSAASLLIRESGL